jgi:hypothetical protein
MTAPTNAATDLDRFAEMLKDKGETGLRLHAVERARSFKRSWLEMARALVEVRKRRAYEGWGYADFFAYCQEELRIKRATVEKLTLSYSTLAEHAPRVLDYDGVAQAIPTFDSVDYLAKALRGMDEDESEPPPRQVIDELKQAVFEEGAPVTALRKRFDPVIHPKSESAQRYEAAQRVRSAVRRLSAVLSEVELDDELVAEARETLERLEEALELSLTELAKAS